MALRSLWKWLRSGKRQPKRRTASRWRHVLPLHLERLEDRTVPTGTIGIGNVKVYEPDLGQTITDSLNPGFQTNEYRFSGFAGERFNFHWVSGAGTGTWEVLGPANNVIGGPAPAFGTDFQVTLPSDGLYDLALIGNQSAAINYSFQGTDVSDAPVALSGFNTTQSGSLAANSNTTFTFTASAGRVVYFDGLNNNNSLAFTLTGPGGVTVIGSSNASSDSGPVSLPRSGTYTLTLPNATGSAQAYSFRLLDLQSDATAYTLGNNVSATSGANFAADVYAFTGTAGHRLYFNGQGISSQSSVQSYLYGPGGVHQVFQTSTTTDKGPVVLGETGTYYLIVSDNSASTPTYGFRLSDVAAAATLNTAGGTTSGSVGIGHTDLYTFTGAAGQRLFFSWTSAYNPSSTYSLYGPGNQLVGSAPSFGTPLDVTLPEAGTYVLALNDAYNASAAAAYTFQAATPPLTSTAISQANLNTGAAQTGNIAAAGQIDSYTFTGSVGQRLYFNALAGTVNTHHATLTSPTGAATPISNSSLSYDVGPFALTEAGTYTLKVSASGQGTGAYGFRLQDLSGAPTLSTSGNPASGSVDPSHTDLYTFTGAAGQRLFFSWTSANTTSGAYFLYGPGNQSVAPAVNFGNPLDVTLPLAGTYVLALNNAYYASAAAAYTFRAATPPLTSTALSQANLNAGATQSGNIAAAGQIDSYTFTGSVGQRLYFNALSGGPNSILATLTSPTGAATPINGDQLYYDVGPFALTEAGAYTLKVYGSGQHTGAYNFRLQDLGPSTSAPTLNTAGGTTSGSVGISHTDLYTFTGAAGQRLFFSWTSAYTGNGTYSLYGPGNQLVGLSTNFGNPLDVTLPLAGTYVLVLNDAYNVGATAAYTFRAATPPLTSTALSQANLNAGATQSGNIAAAGQIDSYTFTGSVGQRLYFDGLAAATNINATLTSPSGATTGINGGVSSSDVGPFTLTEAGAYTLKVSGTGQATGAYSFRLQDVSGAPTLSLLAATGGTLNPGSTDLYQITGSAGQRLSFTWNSGSNSAYSLYGPNNQLIGSKNSGANLQVTLPTGGLYVLSVANTTSASVPYNLRAADDSDAPVALTGFNTTQSGNVPANSSTTFTFNASTGRAVYLNILSKTSSLSFTLTAPDNTSVPLQPGNSNFDYGPLFLPRSGQYVLTLTNATGSALPYSFRLLDLQTFATAYTLGNTVSATSAGAYASEVYSFTGTVGQRLFYDGLANNAALQEWYSVVGPGGEIVSGGDYGYTNVDDSQPRTLTESGTYYLILRNTGSATPAYGFRLLDLTSATALTLSPTLAGATTTSGTLASPGTSADLYSFSGTAGETVYFKGVSGSGGTYYLYGPTGPHLAQGGSFGRDFTYVLPVKGSYTLVAGGYYYNTAAVSYGFQALAQVTTTAAYTLGATQAGNIATPAQVDNYTFNGAVGQRVYFDGLSNSSSVAMYVLLTSPSGQAIDYIYSDVGRDTGPYTLTEAGTYTVTISSYGAGYTGAYSFRVLDLASAAALTLSPTLVGATTTSATLASPGTSADLYSFSGSAGQTVFLKHVSGSGGNYFVYGPTNQLVAQGSFQNDFQFVLPLTATYTLVVAGNYYNTAAVSYSFQALAPATATAAYTLGATQAGNIATPGQFDRYTFTGSVGQRIFVDGLSGPSTHSLYALLTAPSGQVVSNSYYNEVGADQPPYTLPETGTYTLMISNYGGGATGAYSFRVLDMASAAAITPSPTLAGATTTSGTLASPGTSADLYTLSGTAGEIVYFKSVSGSRGTYLLYGPTLQPLSNTAFGSDFQYVLPVTGTYTLVAAGSSSNTAAESYSFQALAPVTTTAAYTLGATQAGTLATPGHIDRYTFAGAAGQRVYFDGLTGSTGVFVALTAPSGQVLNDSNQGVATDQGPFTLAEPGTYTVSISGNGAGGTGAYSFRLLDAAKQPEILSAAVFTVTLSQANASAVTVNYATQDHTAHAGTDYLSASGSVIFNPGETTETIKIFTLPDPAIRTTVDFFVNLSNPTAGTTLDAGHSQGVGTIINPTPIADNQSVYVGQNTPTSVTLISTDPNGDPLTYAFTVSPTHGTLSGTAPNLTYTPANNYLGSDSIQYTVTDVTTGKTSTPATISITVTQIPAANNQAVIDGENTAKAITLTGNAPNNHPLSYTVTSNPTHGTLSGTTPNLTYTPNNNYLGSDSFQFTVTDTVSNTPSPAATVSITVVPPPVASGQSVIDGENTARAITLTNTDPNGDPLSYTITVSPVHGALTGAAPNLTFTPSNNYTGADSFTFTVTDTASGLVSNAATVSITVVPPPVASGQSVVDGVNTAKAITLTNTDPNNDPLSYTITASPAHGALSGTAPNLTFTPSSNYTGADSFTFTVTDTASGLVSNAATITMTVVPPPVANGQSVSVNQNTATSITLTSTDPNNDPLSYTVTVSTAHGALSGTAPNLTYTPNNNYSGADSLQFTVTDTASGLTSNTATISITVQAGPAANGQSVIDGENTAKSITLTGSAPNNHPLSYTVTSNPAHGSLSGTAPNLTYTPSNNYTGSDSFQFTVKDTVTNATSSAATVSITVVPPPGANGQAVIDGENTAKAITLTNTDPNNDPLSYTITVSPAHGALSGTAPNLTFTPSNNYTGADSFTFTVTDTASGLVSNAATISITVVPPPVANGQSVIDGQNTARGVILTSTDPNGDPLTYSVGTPAHGTLNGTAPNLTFTPSNNYTGTDSFTFRVTDTASGLVSNAATISITVVPPPVANGQAVIDGQNTAKAITLSNTDPNNDPLSYTITVSPAHGALGGTAPNLTYTPSNNYTGADSFTFSVTDTASGLTSNAATISITVVPPPVANSQSVSVNQNTPTGVTLTSTDPNGDPLTFTVTASPAHGILSGTAPNLTYTPAPGYAGADSFQFTVTDTASGLTSNTATVGINVTSISGVATTYNWTGAVSTDWNASGNWTDSSDANHHSVPGAADAVVIGTTANSPTLSSAAAVGALQVIGTDTFTLNADLTVNRAYVQNSGAVIINGAHTLTLAGNATFGATATVTGTGGVVFAGTAPQTVRAGVLSLPDVTVTNVYGVTLVGADVAARALTLAASANLYLNGSYLTAASANVGALAKVYVLGSSRLTVAGDFQDYGAVTIIHTAGRILIGGNLTGGANLSFGTAGAVVFNGTAPQSVRAGALSLPNVIITNVYGVTLVGADVTVGALTLTASANLYLNGSYLTAASASVAAQAKVYVLGSSRLTVAGDFQDDGTFTIVHTAGRVFIGGNLTVTTNTSFGTAGTVVFNGTAPQSIRAGALSLPNVTITNPYGVTLLGADVTVGALTLAASATLQLNGSYLSAATASVAAHAKVYVLGSSRLTVAADFQDYGAVTIVHTAGRVIIGGNLTGGANLSFGTVGTVVFNGAATQVVSAGVLSLPNAILAAGRALDLRGVSQVTVVGDFQDSGKVFLVVAVPNSANPAPLIVQGTLALTAATVFDFTVGAPTAGNVYFFVRFGTLVDNPSASFFVHGNGAFTPAVRRGANSITVTLS